MKISQVSNYKIRITFLIISQCRREVSAFPAAKLRKFYETPDTFLLAHGVAEIDGFDRPPPVPLELVHNPPTEVSVVDSSVEICENLGDKSGLFGKLRG